MNELDRFLSKVKIVDIGCHEWQSTIHRDGYGKFHFRGKQEPAHRVAYKLQVGEIINSLFVLHKCDNRKCVNIEHLYLGNSKQNHQDMIDRCAWHGNMRIPFETVQEARNLYKLGMSQEAISALIGVHQSQVSKYIRNKQRINK